ncbi:hypothetical protein, partial [uncultured Thermomonospora sp.]|uniref:hypothetical protein n=1 Tax=uncultured Thermomonospora sp. TaxID=671175 RepID=UPI00259B87DB
MEQQPFLQRRQRQLHLTDRVRRRPGRRAAHPGTEGTGRRNVPATGRGTGTITRPSRQATCPG